jgi:hypothetical protein
VIVHPEVFAVRLEDVEENPVVPVDLCVRRHVESISQRHRAADWNPITADGQGRSGDRRLYVLLGAAPGCERCGQNRYENRSRFEHE